eukprot:CAMPEP_0171657792 /NCGR_PEP_ID=MMETSP0990-20121206/42514_1 /TAXON_ID=483369 /ORGANISM="non described non described, Strain CCMP2098" /LENGTH=156 /DNA_ID=CAMNT_0012238777 /DNA_START=1180 /DNA_END=1651 /DNA_ORIENTATION=+
MKPVTPSPDVDSQNGSASLTGLTPLPTLTEPAPPTAADDAILKRRAPTRPTAFQKLFTCGAGALRTNAARWGYPFSRSPAGTRDDDDEVNGHGTTSMASPPRFSNTATEAACTAEAAETSLCSLLRPSPPAAPKEAAAVHGLSRFPAKLSGSPTSI